MYIYIYIYNNLFREEQWETCRGASERHAVRDMQRGTFQGTYTYIYIYIYLFIIIIIIIIIIFREEQWETCRGGQTTQKAENMSRWFLDFSARAGLNVFPRKTYLRSELRSPNISEKLSIRQVFIISNRKTSNWASQILKANRLLMCPYCLKFQIARV